MEWRPRIITDRKGSQLPILVIIFWTEHITKNQLQIVPERLNLNRVEIYFNNKILLLKSVVV